MKRSSAVMVFTAAVFLFFLAGCAKAAVPASGNTWRLTSIAESANAPKANLQGVPPALIVTLSVDNNMLSGFAGVNSYHGSYSADGSNLKFGPFAMTMMMSSDPVASKTEQQYMQVLDTVRSIKETPATLTMYDGKKNAVLVFDLFTLEGTSWKLTGYNSGNAVVSLDASLAEAMPEIAFHADKKFSGSTGYNNIMGSYVLKSGTSDVSIQAGGTTRMAVPTEQASAFEKTYLALLAEVVKYTVSGNNLTLSDNAGVNLLTFVLM